MITINFASVKHLHIDRIRTALFAAAAVLLLTTAIIIAQARTVHREANASERELAALKTAQEKLRPAIEERQRIVKNLESMSALLTARKFSWVHLLSELERAFPTGVALSSISIDPKDGSVSLDGSAQSPEALSRLMIGLQGSRSFRNPKLKRQSLEKGNLEFHVDVVHDNIPTGMENDRPKR